ncbi:E3 ufm1-protein ligase 1-like protein [Thalictrum thalictroides]|uniref:E3 ufm1-protein ligase 1-like protein n=1 Tax=Thalictrum thalictroides TaxID=46969 RepID=A0A7J6VYT4_THATH|nr:E3 ufm1-protein ligase 1-like protein [Thalictrum thalictroides]
MDAELLELQRQFEFAQQAKSSIRLSDRNVVELVQKLQHLQIIDYDLLHTITGKEYITPDQLRHEMVIEINKTGRVSLIDLADVLGVDLYHIEKQAQYIVADDPGLMFNQGEIIQQSYWDGVAEEINERLQECSHIALAELAAQLHIGSELISTVLECRLGTIVKGRLEGGQLYTPVYVARVSAMVRGATRAVTVPTNLSIVWNSLQQLLQDVDGANGIAVESTFFQSLFNGLVKEGEVLGSVRAGIHWTPSIFAHAQRESVDSFFSQNSYISYQALQKLAIPQPKQYLQSRYPEGIPLDTVFVHPSMIEMLDSAAEDAIEQNSWIDSLSVFPAFFGTQDASKILSLCPSIQKALKSSNALILGDSCVLSNAFVKDVFEHTEKEMGKTSGQGLNDSFHVVDEAKSRNDPDKFVESNEVGVEAGGKKSALERGSRKKRGKTAGNAKTGGADSGNNEQEISTKAKKNQRKSKDQVSDTKVAAKKDPDKAKMDNHNDYSEELIMEKILMLVPDFEGLEGMDDPHSVLRLLATYLRPMLLTSLRERRKALLNENAERMRRLLDNLQKKVDEAFINLQLNEKALDLFEDDPSASVILHKHLLRTTSTSIVDMLLINLDIHNKLKNGIEVEESDSPESVSLSSGDRLSLAKGLTGPLSVKAVTLVETLEGKRVENFMAALASIAEESGLLIKKLDKKLERTLLHSYRKYMLKTPRDLLILMDVEISSMEVLM